MSSVTLVCAHCGKGFERWEPEVRRQIKKGRSRFYCSRSCGTKAHPEVHFNETHGLTNTPTYKIWTSMRDRCNNPKNASWHRYGGRGIYVCERWGSFEAFLADMGESPAGLSLDRIDNDGPYAPWNCRWATHGEQARNRRSTRLLTYQGETMCALDWANRIGISLQTLVCRLDRYGWSVERALSTPVKNTGRRRLA